jgi:hypothetical protein
VLDLLTLASILDAKPHGMRIEEELLEALAVFHVRIALSCRRCDCNQRGKESTLAPSVVPKELGVVNSISDP